MTNDPYIASTERYDNMEYRRLGRSGLRLPGVSLGLWQNFGGANPLDTQRDIVRAAFDMGITHFDLANNYGPPAGSAEENFGRLLASDLAPYRDEIVIATKAGYYMHPGPYGEWGSRKYLLSSLDASLKRMGLDYVDVFYHHRPDPDTPIEESMMALDQAVRSGRALYAGISNYGPDATREAAQILRDLGTPLLVHQFPYNMYQRGPENGLLDTLDEFGVGSTVFSPLAQGMLTARYLNGVPEGSRATHSQFLNRPSRSPRPTSSARARSTPLPRAAASRSLSSRCSGCCAEAAPRRRSSARLRWRSSRTRSALCRSPISRNEELAAIEPNAVEGTHHS